MAANPESILDTIKQALGIADDYTAFDLEVTIFINSAIGNLQQMGVGASTGFAIADRTTLWSQFVTQLSYLGMVKSYIYMAVRLAFDPPATSFGLDAVTKQLEQLAWRICVAVEAVSPPSDPFAVEEILEYVPDGGVLYEGGVMPRFFAPKVIRLPYAPIVIPDASLGNVFYLTLEGDCELGIPINATDGQHITFGITSAGYSITWANGWNFGDSGTPVLSPAKTDIVSAVYSSADTEWHAGFTTGF